MRIIATLRTGLSALTNSKISPLILLLIFVAMATTAEAGKGDRAEAIPVPISVAAQPIIPPGPIISLATSSGLPNIMAVSFEGDPLPLYSQDGGTSWRPVRSIPWGNDPLPSSLLLAITPRDNPMAPTRLLVAVPSKDPAKAGIYRTDQYGLSWSFIPFEPPSPDCPPVHAATIHDFTEFMASPADPKRLYLIKRCSNIVDDAEGFRALFISPDSGETWQRSQLEADTIWWSSVTPSPSIPGRVYVVAGATYGGSWYQSDDGGVHWSPKDFPVGWLVPEPKDPNLLYGVYEPNIGRRSTDGGKTWLDWVERPPCGILHRDPQPLIAQPKLSHTLLFRCDQGLFRSEDGGDHWVKLSPWYGQGEPPWYGQGLWVDYGLRRSLWVRNDGLWRKQNPGWAQITDSYQINPLTLWQNASVPTTVGAVNSIAALSSGNLWAVGEGGLILHWQGQEWLPTAGGSAAASLFDVAFASPNEGWAVGGLDMDPDPYDTSYTGIILHWNGNSWTEVSQPAHVALRGVKAVSADNAWAVGDGGTILHWNGQNWQTVSSPTTLPLLSVDFVSSTDGWIAGGLVVDVDGIYEGIILHWNGSSWSTVTTPPYLLASIDMLSSSEGWSVGGRVSVGPSGSRILHWDGKNWQEVPHPTTWVLTGVSMVSADEGWAVGSKNFSPDVNTPRILHWDGQTWRQESVATELIELSVEALSPHEAWITGRDGKILRYWNARKAYLPWILKD